MHPRRIVDFHITLCRFCVCEGQQTDVLLEMALSHSIEVNHLLLNTLKLDTQSRFVGLGHLLHILPDLFNSLSTKYFIYKETLSKSSSLFWRNYSTPASNKVKFTALIQKLVYSCLSISNIFELLETAWINIWPLLFATDLRPQYWHCSRDEPRSVFSYAHHALPVLWLTVEAPGSPGFHMWSTCSSGTGVLYFEVCCQSAWPHSPTKPCHCPSKTGLYAHSSSKHNALQFLAISIEETYAW